MGLNMTTRLIRGGHRVAAYDRGKAAVDEAASRGARPVASLEALVDALPAPRVLWAMIPAGDPVDQTLEAVLPKLARGDLFVDGGNSNFRDSQRRAAHAAEHGVAFVDAGVSGGIWGLENGFCLMVGGERTAIERLRPALETLAPPDGWLHAGPSGAGHFSKMVHNGIEYGMMQAYGEGFELLAASEFGYDLPALARLWNHGSVVRSWLLELAADALGRDPRLEQIRGWVEDSGEGRWTVLEAVERGVAVESLALALFARFRSRQNDAFANRLIAALRNEFGGHAVKAK
jgi:6-phosphogluconate dehydrogenase